MSGAHLTGVRLYDSCAPTRRRSQGNQAGSWRSSHVDGSWREPIHNTPETLCLTELTPRSMLGMKGLLNLLTWVEHRQLASPHEEGGVPCPVSHLTRLPPARFQDGYRSMGGSAANQSSTTALAAESPARTSVGAKPHTTQGGRR